MKRKKTCQPPWKISQQKQCENKDSIATLIIEKVQNKCAGTYTRSVKSHFPCLPQKLLRILENNETQVQ